MQNIFWEAATVAVAGAGALVLLFTALCFISVFTERDFVTEFLNLYSEE